jgi:hypothetical protein
VASATEKDLANNALLAILRDQYRGRLLPHVHAVDLAAEALLQKAGQVVSDTWFPCGAALAAFSVSAANGQSVDVALVGREGAVGGVVSNGEVPAFADAKVRFAGRFLRVKTAAQEQAKLDSISLRHWFARYSDCLFAHVFQTSACNASHSTQQRAAKWLLAGMARTGTHEIAMTQEHFAEMLGVGRPFVSRVVARLRADGVIRTRRGSFRIMDEERLRSLACDCTAAIEDHFDAVLHGIYPHD